MSEETEREKEMHSETKGRLRMKRRAETWASICIHLGRTTGTYLSGPECMDGQLASSKGSYYTEASSLSLGGKAAPLS